MHSTPDALIEEEGASPSLWFWYSGQRSNPFAFATTKGTTKPKRKTSTQRYGTANQRVLAVMSKLAVHTGYACPSVKTIMKEADCSRSTAKRARQHLQRTGALVADGHSGPKYRGTAVFVVPQMNPNVDIEVEDIDRSSSCFYKNMNTSAFAPDPAETQAKAHEEEQEQKSKERGKAQTPTAPSPNCAAPLPKKPWPVALTCDEYRRELQQEVFDSQLVRVWKAENKKAGFGVPTITGREGAKLRQIARGKKAVDYLELRDQIIPCVIAHWEAFKGFYRMHAMSNATGPAEPSVGYLSRQRDLAKEFCENVKADETFVWGCLSFYAPKPKKKKKFYMPFAPEFTWEKKSKPKQSLDELIKQFNQLAGSGG